MFEQVTNGIYAIADGSTVGNVGLIATDHGNFIIDTSMYPKVARDIRRSIESIGTGKLQGGFYTHYHFDHTGGAQKFHDVPMYGHELLDHNFKTSYLKEDFLKNFENHHQRELFEGLELTRPSEVFQKTPFSPPGLPDLEIHHHGGHTSGSSILHYKAENVVFAGDNVFNERYPWGGDPSADPYSWLNSMQQILAIGPKLIVPGHGAPCKTDVIQKYRDYLTKIISRAERLTQDGADLDVIVDTLSEIEFFEEMREGMKKSTLEHWCKQVQYKSSSN